MARPTVLGVDLDPETRCAHWHSPPDIVAIRMRCCGDWYACKDCHDAIADHPIRVWPRGAWDQPAVMCGACGGTMSVSAYLACGDCCPACGARFNPGCRLHRHFYFESDGVRPARLEDAAALRAILHDTFESTWRPQLTEAALQATLAEDRPAAFVAEHGREFKVAERDGEVVGLIYWQDDFVHSLHVRSSHARTGVGGQLMDLAEAAIAAAGFDAARLETDTFNTAAQAFYAGRGYREAGRYPDEEWNSGLTTLLLVKPLG
jgi:uncharacterized CHY-type Zn-finger protein/predicted N-acetyltransferase YhbS